ncbi:MAG: DedA family protein [Sedimentisphaerales bacterium]|nr:DedA family protein [Sedimentisphaerales bacterium]
MPEESKACEKKDKTKVSRWHLHRRLYDWVLHWADTPYGGWALFILAFAESSFFPVPPDVLLAPLTLGNRKKWFRFALSCSLASVVGGMFGYLIGFCLWSTIGHFFHEHIPGFNRDVVVLANGDKIEGLIDPRNIDIKLLSTKAKIRYPITLEQIDGHKKLIEANQVIDNDVQVRPFTKIAAMYNHYDWEAVGMAGFTPLPFKVFTITAGVFKINFFIFCISAAISRSARFFLVAGLFGRYGEKIKPFIDKYFNWLCLAFVVLLVGGFFVLKYWH